MLTLRPEGWVKVSQERGWEGRRPWSRGSRHTEGGAEVSCGWTVEQGSGGGSGRSCAGHVVEFELDSEASEDH